MTVWLKAIYSAKKDIICTTKINKNVTRSGRILCLTVIFVCQGWHAISRRRLGPKHSYWSSHRWWILAFGKRLLQRISIKKNISTFCLQQSQDNLNKEIFSFILGFSLLWWLNAVDQSSLLKELSQSMFCQRVWHHIRFFWFRHDRIVLFITLKGERKSFIYITDNREVAWGGFLPPLLHLFCKS